MAERVRTRRRWSHEEKREIAAQTPVPGMLVSQVARRYDANANLVTLNNRTSSSWLRSWGRVEGVLAPGR